MIGDDNDFIPKSRGGMPPEIMLQVAICVWVKKCVTADHEFHGFDRHRGSDIEMMWEKKRGIRAGEFDTLLEVLHYPSIWIELKWGDNQPSDNQIRMYSCYERVGRYAGYAWNVLDYYEHLKGIGIPMVRNAEFFAKWADEQLNARIEKRKHTSAKPRKKRVRSSYSTVKAQNRIRSKILF